jgi:hypothetical protein
LGELIAARKNSVGLKKGAVAGGTKERSRGSFVEARDVAPTLAEAGLDKKLSGRAQKANLENAPEHATRHWQLIVWGLSQ